MKKSIGIIGGMGPLATCDLMEKIIRLTDAAKDQEYNQIYVDCNTAIPDRTSAILGNGESPLPELIKSAQKLQAMGADLLTMSCNTAHFFWEGIQEAIDIPLLHMPRETAAFLKEKGIKKAAVLSSAGTVRSGIYDKALKERNILPIYPNEAEQQLVMSIIYDCVKAGKPCTCIDEINAMGQRLIAEEGAEVLILACTELPIAFRNPEIKLPTVDPTEILAKAAITAAGGKLKK